MHEATQRPLQSLLQKHFPLKSVKRHSKDIPWVMDYYRSLIRQRQPAFMTCVVICQNTESCATRSTDYQITWRETSINARLSTWRFLIVDLGGGILKVSLEWILHPQSPWRLWPCQPLMVTWIVLSQTLIIFFKSVSVHIPPISPHYSCLTVDCNIPDSYLAGGRQGRASAPPLLKNLGKGELQKLDV